MASLKITTSSWFKKYTKQSSSLSDRDKAFVTESSVFDVKYAFKVGNHLFVELSQAISPVGNLGFFFASHVNVEIDEFRGVWLTNVDSKVLFSRNNINVALDTLEKLQFNTLYPVVWNRNYTLYESDVAKSIFGSSILPEFAARAGDMMQDILELAQNRGFRVIPWFEYGLMTLPKSELFKLHPDWFTQDVRNEFIRQRRDGTGQLVNDDHVWLNPCRSEVVQFMTDLIGEFLQKYPTIHGIQLDDHFGMPKEMGHDSFTVELYQRETGETIIPKTEADAGWAGWVKWRSGKVTALMRSIFMKVKSINQNCLISLSPNPQDFSRANYMADWTAWESEGLIEELVVQIYRDNAQSVKNELDNRALVKARDNIPTGIGLFTGSRQNKRLINQIQEQTQVVRDMNFAGISYFFYETLVNQQIEPTLVARNPADFGFLS